MKIQNRFTYATGRHGMRTVIRNEGKIKELKHRAPKEVKEWMTENDRA